tara:strand:- start:28 stop:156 length:129 start_codon:yes stop_codon:yes gene_type:complete
VETEQVQVVAEVQEQINQLTLVMEDQEVDFQTLQVEVVVAEL